MNKKSNSKKCKTISKSVLKQRKNVKFIQRGKSHMDRFQRGLESMQVETNDIPSLYDPNSIRVIQSNINGSTNIQKNSFDMLMSSLFVEKKADIFKNPFDDGVCEYRESNPGLMDLTKEFNKSEKLDAEQSAKSNIKSQMKLYNSFEPRTDEGEEDVIPASNDNFDLHLDFDLTLEHVEDLVTSPQKVRKMCWHWPALGAVNMTVPHIQYCGDYLTNMEKTREPKPVSVLSLNDLKKIKVKAPLVDNTPVPFTPFQAEIFSVLNYYLDFYYPHSSEKETKELRLIYCLHALNHVLKTRSRILLNNAKLNVTTNRQTKSGNAESPRDMGLFRPKVLIVLPFRDSAFRVVNTMCSLLYGNKAEACKSNGTVVNYNRFFEEYTGNTIRFPKTNPKPEDYEKTFSGNTDDNFRIGISLTKKNVKLYSDFHSSDILIASPLGLRLVIGASKTSERNYDFLNSIELLIIDKAELIFAQNWENLLYVVNHLHLQPCSLRDTDLQRVRTWALTGLSRFYRQTLLLTSHELPEFQALFSGKCWNYRGKVRVSNPVVCGDNSNVIVSIPQYFQKIDAPSIESLFERRFQYFIHDFLPRFKTYSLSHCMIFIPSYFDFVRIRNYFKAENISFVQICEYTNKEKIARARDIFFHSGVQFLLYSERAHFFRRTRIKGVRHLIMYQPPTWPHFFSEIINLMHEANQNANDHMEASMSITVLYTKYDVMQLSAILGSETAVKLLKSTKTTNAFVVDKRF